MGVGLKVREVNQAGVDLIKSFEGIVDGDPSTVNLDPYVDPVGILTIGWGHAITFGERFLNSGPSDRRLSKKLYPNGITREEAELLLKHDIEEHSRDISSLVRERLTDNQYAALASFTFNLGVERFKQSTMLRFINDRMFQAAADQFPLYNKGRIKSKLRVIKGLVRRRAAERELFLKVGE